jgi:hypothetical protein
MAFAPSRRGFDEVQISGPAAPGADGKLSPEVRFGAGGK